MDFGCNIARGENVHCHGGRKLGNGKTKVWTRVMNRDTDTLIGAGMTAAGSVGLTIQVVTDYAQLAVIGLNALLALGGLYLLWTRIRKAHGK